MKPSCWREVNPARRPREGRLGRLATIKRGRETEMHTKRSSERLMRRIPRRKSDFPNAVIT